MFWREKTIVEVNVVVAGLLRGMPRRILGFTGSITFMIHGRILQEASWQLRLPGGNHDGYWTGPSLI